MDDRETAKTFKESNAFGSVMLKACRLIKDMGPGHLLLSQSIHGNCEHPIVLKGGKVILSLMLKTALKM